MNELTKNGEDFRKNKKQVSNAHYYSYKFLSLVVVAAVGYIVYTQNSQTLEAGIMAIGGTCIMFAFLANSGKVTGKKGGTKLIGVFVLLWLLVEMVSAFGARMAVSNSHSLNQMREIKSDAKAEIARLVKIEQSILKAGHSPADEAALLAANSRAIKKEKNESKLIIDSDEQKLHSDIEKITGVSNIGSIRYGVMSALFILGASLLVKMSGGMYCNRSLKKHLKQSSEMLEIMASCEGEKEEVNKNVSPEDLKEQGTQKDEPKVKGDMEAVKRWIASHLSGSELSTKELRKATGTSIQIQQNAIIKELFNTGYLTRVKKGNIYKYSRADAKTQALSTMQKTRNFLSIVKSK